MKKLSLLVLTLAVLIFVFSAFAHDMAKNGNAVPTDSHAKKITKPGKSAIAKTAADEPVIFSDDFEAMEPHWIPDASWAKTALGDGRAYQPVSAWSLTDQNSSSPTHSWHAVEGNEELDFLVSPVITLPMEVETGGVTSELKGLKLGFDFDIDTPDGNADADQGEQLKYMVGPEEVLWTLSGEDVAAGTSAHYLDPTQGSTDMHWRQWLVSPEIDLTGATGTVNFTFSHDYENEPAFDYYAVDISTDDFLSYTNLGFYGETGTSEGWQNESFDISAYAGQVVKIRFSSKGDYGTAEGFWAVDEIKVTDDTGDLFYDDGGEDGTTEMVASGFFGPDVPNGYDPNQVLWSNTANPNPNWVTLEPPLEVVGFKTNYGPGSDVRVVFWWNSDDDEPQGRGLFIDDVNLFGVGLLSNDLAVSGIKGLMTAA
ncbi:MAG: hypothetical protein GXO75_06655, partial [Calditrichaeota bacterium]|nr:hypothetical protein [Calditrichota bacterium]